MKILFIGYSNVFKKRILPILDKLPYITEVHIAKYKDQIWDNDHFEIKCQVKTFDSYEEDFYQSDADIAYISSVNSDHFKSAKIALEKGLHTIIDKPATLSLTDLETLLNISTKKNILLAESVVYTYHPKVKEIKNIFNKKDLQHINVIFSFPPLDSNNFRYKEELGGGVINDTGPYAASIGRYFFNEIPKKIYCNIVNGGNETFPIDICYTILMEYSSGRTLTGLFSFITEYVNMAQFLGKDLFISTDRIFSIPENSHNLMSIKTKDYTSIHYTEKGNSFLLFFEEVLSSIRYKNYKKFENDMYMDGQILNMIRSRKNF